MTESFEDRASHPEPQGDGALLTAYLFGELAQDEAGQLEQRLAAEPKLQAQFQALQETLHVLQQAESVQGPVILGDEARSALRVAAAEQRQPTGPSHAVGSGPRAATGGALLNFPWLRAAAAVLIVAGGYSVYQAGGGAGYAPNSDSAASHTEASALDRVSETAARAESERAQPKSGIAARLGRLGYTDSESAGGDSELTESLLLEALGYVAGGASVGSPAGAVAPEQAPASPGVAASTLDPAEVAKLQSLGYPASEGSRARAEKPELAKERSQPQVSPGSAYKGPGDSVPPPSEKVVGRVEALQVDAFSRQLDEVAIDGRVAESRLELERKAFKLQSEAGWLGDSTSFGENFSGAIAARGYSEDLAFDADQGVSAGLSLRSQTALPEEEWTALREAQAEQLIMHIRPVSEEEDPTDMFFRYYGDNAFVDAGRDNFSTFSIDVDSASYPMARNYLASGQLPPRASVRTEEVVNYFSHDLVAPQEDMFAVTFFCAPTPFTATDNHVLLEVGVKAREVDAQERMPMNLVFVVDKSGSMREGGRMDLIKRSLELVLDQLRDDDRVGIVSFDREGHIVQESIAARERWRVRESLRNLQPGGSTNAGEGLFLGYEMLDRNFIEGGINRVVLASDGVANTGETDQARILQQVEDFTTRSVDLTTVGVGMGNHNDVFLEQLANQGNGSCHYIDSMEESRRVFLDEFSSTMQTVARDVKIQVEFDPTQVKRWRQLGYENRSLTKEQFRDDTVDAGEVGAGHEIVALYELELSDETAVDADSAAQLATVNMRWKPDLALTAWMSNAQAVVPGFSAKDGRRAVERSWQFSREAVSQAWNEAPARFRMAAVAAQFAEYLRRSFHVRGDDYALLEANAEALARELDSDASVRELRDLIRSTRTLVQRSGPQDELWQLIEEGRRLALLQQELRQDTAEDDQTRELMVELIERNSELEQRIRDYLEQRD